MEEWDISEFRVIKYGNLSNFVSQEIQNEIRRVVKTSSRVAIFASIRIHTQAMEYARKDMDDHLNTMFTDFNSDSYFRESFTCPDAPFSELFRNLNINEEDTTACGQTIAYLAREFDRNLKNNVVFRHRRWLKVLFVAYFRSNQRDDPSDKAIADTLDYLCYQPPNDSDSDDGDAPTAAVPVPDRDFIEFLQEQFHIDCSQAGYFGNILEKWSTHIPFFLKVQIFVHGYNVTCQTSEAETESPPAKKKAKTNAKKPKETSTQQLTVFRIIPIHTWSRKHVRFDRLSLLQILNTQRNYGDCYNDETQVETMWRENFNLSKLSTNQMQRFAYRAVTNGEDLCLLFYKKTTAADRIDDGESDSDASREMEIEQMESSEMAVDLEVDDDDDNDYVQGDFFIGKPPGLLPILCPDPETLNHFDSGSFFERKGALDLGQRNLYAAVYDENGRETTKILSQKTYKYMLCQDSFNEKHRKITGNFAKFDTATQEEIKEKYGELPSSRSPNALAFLQYKLTIAKRGTETYMSKAYTDWMFSKFQRRQIVLSKIANDIANGKRTLLFMGSPPVSENSPIRGHIKMPLHDLFHVLQNHPLIWVIVVDEYLTTQLCSYCDQQVIFAHGGHTVHCQRCLALPNGQSGTMDRDINAARNILRKGVSVLTYGRVGEAFCRGS